MKRRRYTDEERAEAVLWLRAAGYPDKVGSLQRVANELNIPRSTLSRWARGRSNPAPSNIAREKKATLLARINELLDQIAGEIGAAVPDAPLRELSTAFGILFDKRQLLIGEPTGDVRGTYVIDYAADHQSADAPPWAGPALERPDTVHRGGLWAQVGQDDGGPDHVH